MRIHESSNWDDLAAGRRGNLAIATGIVAELATESSTVRLSSLEGHSDNSIFVFEKTTNRLLHALQEGDSMGMLERLALRFGGVSYAIYAVSRRAKRLRFVADIPCGNVVLPKVGFILDLQALNEVELAKDVMQGSDPILSFCETLLLEFKRSVSGFQLNGLNGSPQLSNQLCTALQRVQVRSEILGLAYRQLDIPPLPVVAQTGHANLEHEAAMQRERAKLAIEAIALDLAGVTDPHMRLMLSDPANKSETLKRLLDHRLQQAEAADNRENRALKEKLELVGAFLRGQISDHTSLAEVSDMLRLLDEAQQPSRSGGFRILDGRPALPEQSSAAPAAEAPQRAKFRVLPNTATSPAGASPPPAESPARPRFQQRSSDTVEGEFDD